MWCIHISRCKMQARAALKYSMLKGELEIGMSLWGKQLTLTEGLYVLALDTVSSEHCVSDGRLLSIVVTYMYLSARSDCLSEAPPLTSRGICVMWPSFHFSPSLYERWGEGYDHRVVGIDLLHPRVESSKKKKKRQQTPVVVIRQCAQHME